ncbi:MAG: TonB family protein [Nitrospinaceae bacterium]
MKPISFNKTPMRLSALISAGCHLLFAMTAGAYFLTPDPPLETREIRVQLIKKEEPEHREIKQKQVERKLEVAPVVEPVQIEQPPVSQPVIQLASAAMPTVDFQPVMMETMAALPQEAVPMSRRTVAAVMNTTAPTPQSVRPVPTALPPVSASVRRVTHTAPSLSTRGAPARALPAPTAIPGVQTAMVTFKSRSASIAAPPTASAAPASRLPAVENPAHITRRAGRAHIVTAALTRPQVAAPRRAASGNRGAVVTRRAGRGKVITVANSALKTPSPMPSGKSSAIRPTFRGTSPATAFLDNMAPRPLSGDLTASAGSGQNFARMRPARGPALILASFSPMAPEPVNVRRTDPGALKGYQTGVHRWLSRVAEKYYQRSTARRSNIQGKVMVIITLLRNGALKDILIEKPSQYVLLNQTALQAVRKAAPFTEFPAEIVEDELKLVIPFSFKLR